MDEKIEALLNQYIVFGQKEKPYRCSRCMYSTDDNEQKFCWCTDRDSTPQWPAPDWIKNVDYPRFVVAKDKAKSAIKQLVEAAKTRAFKQGEAQGYSIAQLDKPLQVNPKSHTYDNALPTNIKEDKSEP